MEIQIARELMAAARCGIDDVYRAVESALHRCIEHAEATTMWELRGDRFTCAFTSGGRYEFYANTSVAALSPSSPLGEAIRSGRDRLVEPPLVPLNPSDRFALAVPLDTVPVVAYVAFRKRPDRGERAALLDVCALGGSALAVALDRADDRVRATYDGLTGLLTPRAFRSELATRLRDAPRQRAAPRIALVFLDTDRFKEWNDRYGHAAGDELLRRLAQTLRAHAAGPEDLVARNGGDEFCLVWNDCEKSSAISRAELLRAAIAASFASDPIPITASIGVAAFPVDARTPEALLEAADAAMYDAKRAGRNRVSWRAQRTPLYGAASDFAVT